MPARIDYLRDLRDNPRARTAESQSRVKAATVNAVETAFRKYADAGLVESDNSAPKRYTLTEKGAEELRKLESSAASVNQTPAVSLREESVEPIAAFVSSVVKLAKQHGISISANRVSQETAAEAEADKNLDDKPCPWDDPKVQRLYGLELGLSDLPRRVVRGQKDTLAAIVGNEVSELVARLIQAKEELHSELEDSWWPDKKKRERLEQEISELRRKLGCSEEDAEETQEEGAEQDEDEW